MRIQILKYAAALGAAFAVLAGGAAQAHGDRTGDMPVGVTTAAPAGFIELCERMPAECLATARPSDEMLADVRAWAGRARWASVFQAAGLATAPNAIPASPVASPLPEAGDASGSPARPGSTPSIHRHPKAAATQDVRALKDQRRKRPRPEAFKAPPTAVAPARPAPPPITTPPARPVANVSTEALESLTRRINRAIRRSSDADAYGREDVWALPQGRRPTGDCEDYVLAKRRALIEDGVDPAALSIAIVRTHRGEVHAVLLVSTGDGEKVLDNLTPWVLPWRDAPYQWLERQAPGQPLVWVRSAA